MKRKLLVLVSLLVLCCLMPLEGLAVRYGDVVRITNNVSLNVRSGPGTNYGVIGEVQPENIYPYLGTENGWHHILYTGNIEGYVSAKKSTVEPGVVPDHVGTGRYVEAVVRITHTNSLKIRSGPGKSYGQIGTAYPNETYPYLGPDDGWNRIEYNGREAYVAANRSEVEVIRELPNGSTGTEGASGATSSSDSSSSGSSSSGSSSPGLSLLPSLPTGGSQSTVKCGQCGGDGQCNTCDGMCIVYSRAKDSYILCPSCQATAKCWACGGDGH